MQAHVGVHGCLCMSAGNELGGGDLEKSETSSCWVEAEARQQTYPQTTSAQKRQIPDSLIFAI